MRKVCTTIGEGRFLYAVAVFGDGTARVFQTIGITLWSVWYIEACHTTNPRIPETVRERVVDIVAEQREVLFGRAA
jgi:hypothetical protein